MTFKIVKSLGSGGPSFGEVGQGMEELNAHGGPLERRCYSGRLVVERARPGLSRPAGIAWPVSAGAVRQPELGVLLVGGTLGEQPAQGNGLADFSGQAPIRLAGTGFFSACQPVPKDFRRHAGAFG